MQLYTVHFTTKQIVSQFNDKGVKTGEYEMEYSQTLNALPHSTALTYKKFGNFRMEPYYLEAHKRTPVGSTKQRTEFNGSTPAAKKAAPIKSSSIANAARTGDLAAAISAGAK